MNKQQINRTIGRIVVGLSFAALLAVLSGYAQPPQPDEGTAAHIFQFSIVGLLPMLPAYLMTADWKQPWRSVRLLALSGAALIAAFGALYYLEHHRIKNGKNAGLLNATVTNVQDLLT
jgi:drug/metabolite transporter (DMT)-like permease